MIKFDDFRAQWQGQVVGELSPADQSLLEGVEWSNASSNHGLLLLHGFSSSPAVYRTLIPALKERYDKIYCPLLPGHGESIAAFSAVKKEDWLNASEDAYLHIAKTVKRVDILGLSLGGLLACHLAQKFTPHHLYLLAPALNLHLPVKIAIKLVQMLKWFGFKRVRSRAGDIQEKKYAELAYRQLPLTTVFEILTLIQQFEFKAPQCPTDLFLGRHDKVVDSLAVEMRLKSIPNLKTHWLENAAHVLPLEDEIEAFLKVCDKNLLIK